MIDGKRWRYTTLGEVITLKRGYDLPKRLRKNGTVPIVSSSGVTDTHAEAKVDPPGVVTGRYGTIGAVWFIEEPYWPLNTTLYVQNFKDNNERFIAYLLESLDLGALVSSAAVPGVNRNHLHPLPVKVPDRQLQASIAAALSAFDELIENNRQRIGILEEMTRLLYQEWFVHYRFPGHEGVELVDSSLGPIPEGWKVGQFADLVSEIRDTVPPEDIAEGASVVGLEHLPRRSTTLHRWENASQVGSRRKVFAEGDILFGKIRPYFHKVVDAPISGYSSTDAIIFRPKEASLRSRALAVASSDDFIGVATATSNGTRMPRADTATLMAYGTPHPTQDIEQNFSETVTPMNALRKTLAAHSRKLSEARDLLLPRLVSGELDVSDLDIELGLGPDLESDTKLEASDLDLGSECELGSELESVGL